MHNGRGGDRGWTWASWASARVVALLLATPALLVLTTTDAAVAQGNGFQLSFSIVNPAPAPNDLFGWSVGRLGTDILVGAPSIFGGSPEGGEAYLFDGSTGALVTVFPNPTPATSDFYGVEVAAVGANVLVGALGDDTAFGGNAGAAYLFDRDGNLLHTFLPPTPGASFGASVTSLNLAAIVGDVGASAAYAFDGDPSSPTFGNLLVTFSDPNPGAGDNMGVAVAASGGRVIAGDPFDDAGGTDAGAAYLFDMGGSLLATFVNPNPAPGAPGSFDNYGTSVAFLGSDVLVGANQETIGPTIGAVYLFDGDPSSPTFGNLLETFLPSSVADHFGAAVAAFGGDILIGAFRDDTSGFETGAVYLVDPTGTIQETFLNPTPAATDEFGISVAAINGAVLVGAPRDDVAGSNAGAVYVFETPPVGPCSDEVVAFVSNGSGSALSAVDLTTYEVAPGSGAIVGVAAVLTSPGGVALNDARTTAYVPEGAPDRLVAVDVATGAITVKATTGLGDPLDVAVNTAETFAFVTEGATGQLSRVELATGSVTTVASGFLIPVGVALDPSESTAYVTEATAGTLVAVDLSTGSKTTVASGFSNPRLVRLNRAGNLAFVPEWNSGELSTVDLTPGPTFGAVTLVLGGLGGPEGVALNSPETLAYVTDTPTFGVKRVLAIDLATRTSTRVTSFGANQLKGLALGCELPRAVKVPLRWCGVSGAPSIDNPGQVLETTTDDVMAARHARVNDNIYVPQTRLAFRSGATALVPSYPVLPDPSTAIGAPGDVFLVTELGRPWGVAVNAAGTEALVTESVTGEISRVDLATGAITRVAFGLSNPTGLALNAAETAVFVAERGSGELSRVDLATGTITLVASGLSNPVGVELDATEANAYVAEQFAGELSRVALGTGAVTLVASGLSQPFGFDLDAGDSFAYVAEASSGELSKVTLATGAIQLVASGLSYPTAVALEAGGTSALVSESSSGELSRAVLSSGALSVVASGLSGPNGIAIDGTGANAFVTEFVSKKLSRVALATGAVAAVSTPTYNYSEFYQLISNCRNAWGADPTVTGLTAVHIRRFVDAEGNPSSVIGLGGTPTYSSTAGQLAAGRAMVIDDAFTLPCSQQAMPCLQTIADPPDQLLGHELGHALTLAHGNGIDDNFDGTLDNEGDSLAGPNLMQYQLGTQITEAQSGIVRSEALLHIPDAVVDPVPQPEANAAADPVGDVPAVDAFVDIDTFGLGVDARRGTTTFFQALAGLFPPNVSDVEFFLSADLDNNAATGGSSAVLGFPTTFQGAELAARVEVDVVDGTLTTTFEAFRFRGGSFVSVVDASIRATVETRLIGLVHEPPVAPETVTVDETGQEVRLTIPNALRGAMGSDLHLEAIAQVPGGGLDRVDAHLTLRRPTFPTCTAAPTAVLPGAPVEVTAEGLPPDTNVDLFLGRTPVATGTTNLAGAASVRFEVPAAAATGDRPIVVHASGTAISADCMLTVLPRLAADLKREAIERVTALKTVAFARGDKHLLHELEEVERHVSKSLGHNWIDDTHLDPRQGARAFVEERKAVAHLVQVRQVGVVVTECHLKEKLWTPAERTSLNAECDAIANLLVKADEMLARFALSDALEMPVKNPKHEKHVQHEIETSQEELAKAYKEWDEHGYDHAIDHFKKAWEHAQHVIKDAGKK